MGKKKHEHGVTIAIKLTYDRECNWYSVIAVAKHSEIEVFSESDHSAYQKTSAVTSDFNYPSKYNINFMSTNLSAQI